MTASPSNMAEPIKMLFGRVYSHRPRNHVLDGGTYGLHLANMINDQKWC